VKEVEQERPIPLKKRMLVRVLSVVVRVLCATLRLQVEGEREAEERIAADGGGILCTWHGRTLIPINRFRGRSHYHGMISMSRDGDFQAHTFRTFGIGVIRGSTGRRGVLATREAIGVLERGCVLLFTPDGPRGPSGKVVQPGVCYLAQRTGRAIVPAGISANPRWLLPVWDKFMIPKPFARARLIYGDPIYIAPGDSLEDAARQLEQALDRLEAAAEQAVGVRIVAAVEEESVPSPVP